MHGSRPNRDPIFIIQSSQWLALALIVIANVGCQCLGPTSTCLRTDGPILSHARRLREQHLERSHYTRSIPEPTYEQQTVPTPSRFHPVPNRNVFHGGMMPTETHGTIPMLVGPGGASGEIWSEGGKTGPGNAYPLHKNTYEDHHGFPSDSAPGAISPPIYQPQAMPDATPQLNLNPQDSEAVVPGSSKPNLLEELPTPKTIQEDQVDPVVPPELNRPETQSDKVTHRELIQYPYTLDVDRPYSDWVRGIEPKRQTRVNTTRSPSSFRSAAARPVPVPQGTPTTTSRSVVPASYQMEEFAPPNYAEAFSNSFNAPQPSARTSPQERSGKLLKRVTSYGPTMPPTNIDLPPTTRPKAIQSNGVPYIPSNDPTHPMFQSNLPYVQFNGSGQRSEPVQLHSAMQQSYQHTATRLR